jgi:hypothetical protein
MLTNLQCSIFAISLFFLQSTIPEINIVFLLFVLQFILIKGDVETHPGPGTYYSNTQMNITNNNVDKYISICNINIRSVRNKLDFLQNFADEYDILYVTESHFDVNINNDDISHLISFQKPSPERIVITQAVDFSFILKMIYLVNV